MDQAYLELINETFEYQVRMNTSFSNLFDLSYALVDFQAVLSGFYKTITTEEYEPVKTDYKDRYQVAATSEKRIKLSKLVDLDEWKDEAIKEEVKICKPLSLISYDDLFYPELVKTNERKYPTTSRKFAAKYKGNLELIEFHQGSFVSSLCISIISALFIEFVKKQVNLNSESTLIETQIINNIYVYKDGDKTTTIKAPFGNSPHHDLDARSLIEETIEKVEFDKEDSSKSLDSFLSVLSSEGYIQEKVCYNERGKKTIVNDIERLRGSLFDLTC